MYILFTLFFISLIGIIFMVGQKLVFLRNGKDKSAEHAHHFIPDLQKIKRLSSEKARKGAYLATVSAVRFYVQSGNLIKEKYAKMRIDMEDRLNKIINKSDTKKEYRESKFLKMVSDYKHKIRNIKKEVEEENGKSQE